MQERLHPGQAGPSAFRKGAATLLFGRVYQTQHFALYYTLAPNVHRVLLTTADSTLTGMVDSILAGMPTNLSVTRRDSTLHAVLDSLQAPVPAYVSQAAFYSERAYAYYVDSLGMLAPGQGNGSTVFHSLPTPGRFTVDIADIGNADPLYNGEYYAITYPPPVSILLENDFLFNARWSSGGVIGDTVHAVVNGKTLHSYNREWDLGLKVTLSHEFYHVIQFTYTPDFSTYHAWYELSAVGMEERLASDVDDYFQYLPCLFAHHDQIPLLSTGTGPCGYPTMYGQGIFHQFLTHELGPGFDVKVWSTLKSNKNNLDAALRITAQSYGKQWDTLFSRYAADLAASGRPTAEATAFAPDLPRWPAPAYDTLGSMSQPQVFSSDSLTYRLIRRASIALTKKAWVDLSGMLARRVDSLPGGTGFESYPLPASGFPLALSSDSTALFLALTNSAFDSVGKVQIVPANQTFGAFPNPVSLSGAWAHVIFTAPGNPAAGQVLTVFSETGRHIADIPFAPSEGFWNWNLQDEGQKPVPPGVYFYRATGYPTQALMVLPN